MNFTYSKHKTWIWHTAPIIMTLIIFIIFRVPILQSIGNVLICEDQLKKAEVIFVLSGGANDRGAHAANLYKQGYAQKVICTGKNVPSDFEAMGIPTKECDITATYLRKHGVPNEVVKTIPDGTSTREEAKIIINYCKEHQINNAIVVSSKFHTRRIYSSIRRAFSDQSLTVQLSGAPSKNYNEQFWWLSETGLITVNNEYIKLFVYWITK